MKIRPVGAESLSCGRKDRERHGRATSRFSQFFERAPKFKPVHFHTMKACRENRCVNSTHALSGH